MEVSLDLSTGKLLAVAVIGVFVVFFVDRGGIFLEIAVDIEWRVTVESLKLPFWGTIPVWGDVRIYGVWVPWVR